MKFEQTYLQGAWVIELNAHKDERGYFARGFCKEEFNKHHINSNIVQSNVSFSKSAGTLRGMHFQKSPAAETKLIRCSQGALYDVIIDLRKGSPTYLKHFGIELSASNFKMLYVPQGFAHGFITLVDNTEAIYMVSEYYTPSLEFGVRYNDPQFSIKWPIPTQLISDKDASWPLFESSTHPLFNFDMVK